MNTDELQDHLEDLLDVRPVAPQVLRNVEQRARRRRKVARARRIGLSLAVICVITGGIAVFAAAVPRNGPIVVSGSGSSRAQKPPRAVQRVPAPRSLEDIVGPECKASALADPTAAFRVFDRGLHTPVDFPLQIWCDEAAQLAPAPGGDLTALFTLANGKVTASYSLSRHEVVRNPNGTTSEVVRVGGTRLSTAEARRRLAAQHRPWAR